MLRGVFSSLGARGLSAAFVTEIISLVAGLDSEMAFLHALEMGVMVNLAPGRAPVDFCALRL